MANMNVTDYDTHRQHNHAISAGGYPLAGTYGQTTSHAHALRSAQYLSTVNPMIQHSHDNPTIAPFTQAFAGMNLQPPYASAGRPGSQVSATTEYNGMSLGQTQTLYLPSAQQLLYPGGHILSGTNTTQTANPMYTPVTQYVHQNNYPGYGQRNTDNSPNSQTWTPRIHSDGSQPVPT